MMILNTSIAHIERTVQRTFDLCLKSDTKAFWKTSHKYSNKKDNPDIDLDKKKLILKKKKIRCMCVWVW